jgi:hypothetical protein
LGISSLGPAIFSIAWGWNQHFFRIGEYAKKCNHFCYPLWLGIVGSDVKADVHVLLSESRYLHEDFGSTLAGGFRTDAAFGVEA